MIYYIISGNWYVWSLTTRDYKLYGVWKSYRQQKSLSELRSSRQTAQ
jgi:hypothetical protein